ncbi:hypothetical protein ABB44_08075 [Companilactobacillus farciminis]|nr:hypothetical protein ABB45_08055 [Companilactobacillus farciminis]AKS51874.1 hypothetical protein ABB44_08075 [Companilactobacillus farciminis]
MSLKSRITTIIVFIFCLPFIVSIWIFTLPMWIFITIGQKVLGSHIDTYSNFIEHLSDLIHWW